MQSSAEAQQAVRAFGVEPHEIEDYWTEAEALLRKGLPYAASTVSIESLREDLDAGTAQLWVAMGPAEMLTAVVTRLHTYSNGAKKLWIVLCGGHDMRSWLHFLPSLEAWARSEGCIAVSFTGRPGWARAIGYPAIAALFEKRLDGGFN